jgi:hypothetical protein
MYKVFFTWSGLIVALLGVVVLLEPPHTLGIGLILFGWMLMWIGVYESTSTRLASIESYQRQCAETLEKMAQGKKKGKDSE